MTRIEVLYRRAADWTMVWFWIQWQQYENTNTESLTMYRLLFFIGMTLGGYVGWWVGEYVGLGFMGAFLVSSLGSAGGVYVAWRIMRDYLE